MLRGIGTVVPIFSENCELSVPVQRKTLLVYFLQGFEKTNPVSLHWYSIEILNFGSAVKLQKAGWSSSLLLRYIRAPWRTHFRNSFGNFCKK